MSIDIISKIQTGTPPDTNATQLFLMDVEKFLDALPQQPLFEMCIRDRVYATQLGVPLQKFKRWEQGSVQIFKSTWEKYFKQGLESCE